MDAFGSCNINGTDELDNCSFCDARISDLTFNLKKELGDFVLPLQLALCLLSSLMSIVNIVILTRPAMICRSLNVLLAVLEISNLLAALFFSPAPIVLMFSPSLLTRTECAFAFAFFFGVAWSSINMSSWLSPVVAGWRLAAVSKPLRARTLLTRSRALLLTAFVAVPSFVAGLSTDFVGVSKFYGRKCLCDACDFSGQGDFLYNWGQSTWSFSGLLVTVLFFVVPFLAFIPITLGLTWSLIVFSRGNALFDQFPPARLKRSIRTSAVLIILLSCFVASNLSPYITYLQAQWGTSVMNNPWKYVFDQFFIGLTANILSFLGYYNMATNFRESFWQLLGYGVSNSRRPRQPTISY